MPPKRVRTAWALLLALGACGSPESAGGAVEESPPAPALRVEAGALQQLRWVEGRWMGEDASGSPFYEGYRFENDSTIRSYNYPDSLATAPSDSGTIALRGGEVISGSESASWVASELSEGRVAFVPRTGVQNSFVWERVSPDAWTATLRWPAAGERPAREVVYRMRRLAP